MPELRDVAMIECTSCSLWYQGRIDMQLPLIIMFLSESKRQNFDLVTCMHGKELDTWSSRSGDIESPLSRRKSLSAASVSKKYRRIRALTTHSPLNSLARRKLLDKLEPRAPKPLLAPGLTGIFGLA
jgi:hypothetical protein